MVGQLRVMGMKKNSFLAFNKNKEYFKKGKSSKIKFDIFAIDKNLCEREKEVFSFVISFNVTLNHLNSKIIL